MKTNKLLTLLAASLAVGCVNQTELPQDTSDLIELQADGTPTANSDYRDLLGQLPVRDGRLDGSVGDVEGLRRDNPADVSGWGEPGYTSIYTIGQGRNGAAMTILEIDGGLNNALIEPGAHLSFDIYDNEPGTDLHIYVVGCSGPEENDWQFDQVADNTTIDVSEDVDNPNVLVLDYTSNFTNWETGDRMSVTGRVEVEREPHN